MQRLEILKQARELISDEDRWALEGWGGTFSNRTCAVGAVRRVAGLCTNPWEEGRGIADILRFDSGDPEVGAAIDALSASIGGTKRASVTTYNDNRSHECVLAMFDAAIEREEKAQA